MSLCDTPENNVEQKFSVIIIIIQGTLRAGLAERQGGRLVSGRTSVRYRFGSPLSSKVVVCGHGLVTLSLTINETLKWLPSLLTLMQESFWW